MIPPLPAARQRVRQPATLISQTEKSTRGEVTSRDTQNVKIPSNTEHPSPAYVTVKGGVTVNMENYESVRVDVSVSMPCDPNWDAVEACYQEVSAYVDGKTREQVAIATGQPLESEGLTQE